MNTLDNPVVDKSFKFSIRIVNCYKHLIKQNKDLKSLFYQLLRSGTSIGANIAESQAAASKTDFRNKLRISLKEAFETEFWIKLFFETRIIGKKEFASLSGDCIEIMKLIISIIKNINVKTN